MRGRGRGRGERGGRQAPASRRAARGRLGALAATAAVPTSGGRRPEAAELPEGAERWTVETAVLLDLVEAACAAGAGVPRALAAVGDAVGGARGRAMQRAAGALVRGAGWDEAWDGAPAALRPVAGALRAAWEDGVAPGGSLRAAAEAVRRDRQARAAEAAGRLGVRLVLPLGLCYLPAFVLVGLMPVLVSLARGSLAGAAGP